MFLKDSTAGYRFLGWKIFSSILNILSLCLLSSMVSDDKLAVSHIEDALYVMIQFPLAAFKVLFVVHFQQFDYDMSSCGSL